MDFIMRISFAIASLLCSPLAAQDPAKIDFAHDILPVLKARCVECHANGKYKGGVSFDTRSEAVKKAIVAGKSGESLLVKRITAKDAEAHLFNYSLVDRWGSGHSAPVTSDQYIGVHDSSTTWAGVTSASVSYTLSNTACSHSFALDGWSNTTNGFNRIHYSSDLEHIAVYLGGPTCRP